MHALRYDADMLGEMVDASRFHTRLENELSSRSTLWCVLGTVMMMACSSSTSTSTSDAGDARAETGPLYGVCPQGSAPLASLSAYAAGNYGYTIPLAPGESRNVSFTVINTGSGAASQIVDRTSKTPALSYQGGSYPGVAGTCATDLAAGSTCTLDMTVVAPSKGDLTSLLILEYYSGAVYTTDTHVVTLTATPGSFTEAKHGPLVPLARHGGRVLEHVHLVTVTFSDTPDDSAISAFGDWVVTSSWWRTVGTDYGVFAGTHEHVKLAQPTPSTVTNAAVASLVDEKVKSGALPSAAESAYVFFMSPGTTVTDVAEADGWHNQSPGGNVYGVVLAGCVFVPPGLELDTYTFGAAHELIEAATDPLPFTGYTFGTRVGEVADICDQLVRENGYALPTIWSNSAAAKGDNPCVPTNGAPYVNVDPTPGSLRVRGVSGESTSLTLTGWSTQRVGDWRVTAVAEGPFGGSFTASVEDGGTDLVNNGEVVTLTVATTGAAPAGTTLFLQVSSVAPNELTSWRGNVGAHGVQLVPIVVTP